MSAKFTSDFLNFFIELASNNNKEWFDRNRMRYEENVKKPFYEFTEAFIDKLKKEDNSIKLTAREAIFRINRDIRFSKDKTPYKMYMAAAVSPHGKKHINSAGFYFEFGPEFLRFYQGAYFIDPAPLMNLRNYMKKNYKKLDTLLQDRTFKKYYKGVTGEVQGRIPKEFKELAGKNPVFSYKNIYWYDEADPGKLLDKNLMQMVYNHYKAGEKLCKFLDEGLK